MKNRFGSVPVLVSYWGLEEGWGLLIPHFTKISHPALIFFSSLSQIPFFRFQLKIRKLKKGLYAAKAYK